MVSSWGRIRSVLVVRMFLSLLLLVARDGSLYLVVFCLRYLLFKRNGCASGEGRRRCQKFFAPPVLKGVYRKR